MTSWTVPLTTRSYRDQLLIRYYQSGWRGFTRLWNLLKHWGSRPYLFVTTKYGASFQVDPESYIDSYLIREGYYESEVLEAILPYLKPGAVFWDIGANFGLHTVTAKFLHPEVRVVSIEPSPVMATQLLENCKLNNLQVDLVNVALSDTAKFQTLHLAESNAGMTTITPWEQANYSNQMTCWCDTVDRLVEQGIVPQPTVIKIDVEGSELDVFVGMQKVLQNPALNAIVFEEATDFSEATSHPLYRILNQAGFQIRPLTRQENTHHNLDNFLAVRS